MSVEEYWMGSGIDLEGLWRDFDAGVGYEQKVAASRLHLLRLTFKGHPPELPLFDLEVIYKTIKGTFHDVKAECLTRKAYEDAAPIFLCRVDRVSGMFEFLAHFDPLMTWVIALGVAAMWYRKAFASDEKIDE